MNMNDAGFQVGRYHASPSSSRESSPAPKRQRRSFTPTSDDDDLVIPVVRNEDAETPTPENASLIRQAVGFSSIGTNVNTYQATVGPQPVVPYFLPGQAPSPLPKPKSSKPRAPRRKKGQQFADRTSKFKISGVTSAASGSATPAAASPANSADTAPSSGILASSMMPVASNAFSYANGNATAGTSITIGAVTSVTSDTLPLGTKRTRKSPKRKAPASFNGSSGQPSGRPPPRPPAPISTSVTPYVNPRGSSTERSGQVSVQRTYPASSGVESSRGQDASRPLRMVTLLIEDMRSGIPDPQLAEVRVSLRVANDPEDGFWADAAEICTALQSGPSRIDGPAKAYTMRGRFRQFFMRIDQFDQLQVQSAHLGVSQERTLKVFVEAPVPQGQMPRPPAPPSDARPSYNSGSEREAMALHAETDYRPAYSLATREDQVERLSKSSYAVAQSRSFSPVSESGSYGHSQRTTSPRRSSQHDSYASPSRRFLTPPIPGRDAETQEEKDEAIANYIRSSIENHPGWMGYMQSKAKPQRVSEVLKQYTFVEDRVRELIGRETPAHWDGAPNSYVEKHHVWRVLNLDPKWGEECQETSLLIGFYGKGGSRYEDSRVVDMINDTSPPKANTMERFLRFLRGVDESFTRDALRGQTSTG